MELWDLHHDPVFLERPRRRKNARAQIDSFKRLAEIFASAPDRAAQALVQLAVECCGAASSGISLEESDAAGNLRFRWIAIAGTFSQYIDGVTPRFFSPCGTTIGRGAPQLYTVSKEYYDYLQIEAAPITDGILIPWDIGSARGTLWAVCHSAAPVFDYDDYLLLQALAHFAAAAMRHQQHLRAS